MSKPPTNAPRAGEASASLIRADDITKIYDMGAVKVHALDGISFDIEPGELLSIIGSPHVIHCHDWQSSLAVAFLKTQPELYPRLRSARTILTVHNVRYQGLFDASVFTRLNLDPAIYTRHFEFYGRVNFLKAGLSLADVLTTVSPSYAAELKTDEQGCGLQGVFLERSGDFLGLLNGADYDVWNPSEDAFILRRFSATDIEGKRDCKVDLQQRLQLLESDTPVVSMVARLVDQKGLDILAEAADALLTRDLQFVLLGTGDERYERLFSHIAERHPSQVAVRIGFDEELAHVIEAGSDIFLMPSLYEPSGLNQLYSLKYGTIPIVRATGGLKDSVAPFEPAALQGTGFVFEEYSANALLWAVDQALHYYRQPETWKILMRNAMTQDFSVNRVAAKYIDVYKGLVDTAGPD